MSKFIDKIVGAIAPGVKARRARDKAMAEAFMEAQQAFARSAFKSAETNRLNSHWQAWSGDLNTWLRTQLPTLRNRSRSLVANNPHASSALGVLTNYVIGTGMMPQASVRKMVKKTVNGEDRLEAVEMDAWNDYADDLFSEWAQNVDLSCTPDNPGNWYDLQAMAMRRWFEDGEAFIRTRAVKAWPTVPFACEFLMPEWLDEGVTRNDETGNDIVMGIEIDKYARPVAYHFKSATGDGVTLASPKTIRVPANEILHIFIRHQPRQLRGIPPMVAVMERFFNLDEYAEFELISAKIAACFGAFITSPPGDSGTVVSSDGKTTQVKDAEGNVMTTLEPGLIGKLPDGYGVTFAQPQKPGTTFGMFTEYHQRSVGAGIEFGLSYEALTRDTSKSNFAGGRLSQLMDFQTFRTLQTIMANKLIRPIRRRWLESAINSGALSAPGYFLPTPGPEFWQRCDVLTSGWPWGINPLQEVNASRSSMRAGITTLADEAAYLGRNWKAQLRLKAKIDREAKRLGIVIDSDAGSDEPASTQNVPKPVDEKEPEAESALET